MKDSTAHPMEAPLNPAPTPVEKSDLAAPGDEATDAVMGAAANKAQSFLKKTDVPGGVDHNPPPD